MKTIPHRRIVSALTAGMLVASAGTAGAKSAAEVFAEVAPSVVVVLALDDNGETVAQGSGVVVGKNEVATNCHVIENANSIAVRQAADSGGGETYRMDSRISARDGERDLCLLFVGELSEPPAAPVAAMGAAKGLTVGEDVYAIGAPKGLELSLSRGVVSQLRGVHGKRAAPLVQTDAAISPGSSGGGLFNADGELVGITTFKWRGESLNFAIPAEWVGELWDRIAALAPLRGTPPPRTENFKAGELDANSRADLSIAAYENDIKAMQWLIANGADVNVKREDGWTPLHSAAYENASEAAALLLANGADVNAKRENGKTPLHSAADRNASEAAAVLLANGAEVNAKDNDGRTPLLWAAFENASEAAAVLLANGAEVNAKSNDGVTPLHLVAWANAPEAAAMLIANSADINAKDNGGRTPLHFAAQTPSPAPETAAVLIDNGANVNAKDGGGHTPLDWAVDLKYSKKQSLLRKHGGRCNYEC